MIFNRKKATHKSEEPVKTPEPKPIKEDTFVPDEHGYIIVNGLYTHFKASKTMLNNINNINQLRG